MLWTFLLKLAPLIPGVSSLLQKAGDIALSAYGQKLTASGAHEAKVVELAARELAVQQDEARLNAQAKTEIRHIWYAPENLMFYLVALPYWFKAITMDNVIGSIFELGWSTPGLKGDTGRAMMMVMAFWFGTRAIQSVASIIGAAFGKAR